MLNKKNRFDLAYAALLFLLLLAVALPGFSFPPLSDYWPIFHFFHHTDELPGPVKWLHVMNYDPCEQMRYYPLSQLTLYVFHLLFGSDFGYFNILNFAAYFLSVFLLFRFTLHFVRNKVLSAVCIGSFAFWFNHFDIVLWSYHIYVLIGLCMFLLGFMNYIEYVKSRQPYRMFGAALFFLSGMLCYEAFFFWPLAILILASLGTGKAGRTNAGLAKANALALAATYSAYFLFYLFLRSLHTYPNLTHPGPHFLRPANFLNSAFLAIFNIVYNNIAVVISPFLAFPLKVSENIYMRGPVLAYMESRPENHWVVFAGAAAAAAVLLRISYHLRRKGYTEELKTLCLFLFLLLSETYVVFFCRLSANNPFVYSLTEFRYQYIPNAFVMAAVLFMIDRFLRLTRRSLILLCLALALIIAPNIYCIRKTIGIYQHHFAPLQTMLSSVREGIRRGFINKDSKVYIDDDMPDHLPHLCWNIEMGEWFIREGNYRWMFSKEENLCFSKDAEGASWLIDTEDFAVFRKLPSGRAGKAKSVNAFRDPWYFTVDKDKKYLELGYQYKDRQRFREAEEMFKKSLELNPDNVNAREEECLAMIAQSPQDEPAYTGLGHLYNSQERYSEAEAMFKKALELNADNPSAYDGLGNCYYHQNKYLQSEAMFKKAIELDPDNISEYEELGRNYIDRHKYPEAEAVFARAVEIDPQNNAIFCALGHLYNSQARYPEAEASFKKAVELNPDNASAYDGLSSCYRSQARYPEAEAMFRKALELNPPDGQGYANAGYLYSAQARYPEAEASFKKAIELDPGNARAYGGLANCYHSQQKLSEAEAMFKKAIELDPDDPDVYTDLGVLYLSCWRRKEAEAVFKKALQLNPDSSGATTALGRCYHNQGRFQEADVLFRRALQLNPWNDGAYVGLGLNYKVAGDFTQAEAMFRKAHELNPENTTAYLGIARCYDRQGRFQEAEALLQKALELRPWDVGIYGGLGLHYKDTGDLIQAERFFRRYLEINPNNASIYIELADCLRARQNYREMERVAKEAIKAKPEYPHGYLLLGRCFLDRGAYAQAEALFKKALAIDPAFEAASLELERCHR